MNKEILISQAHNLVQKADTQFPIQVFTCVDKQHLHQVHFYQPTLMLVLRGTKEISGQVGQACPAGSMLLVSGGHEFPFANIPDDFYMALVVSFQTDDFPVQETNLRDHSLSIVEAPDAMMILMHQFMGLASIDVPKSLIASRRKELAQLLTSLGLDTNLRSPMNPTVKQQLTALIQTDLAKEWTLSEICPVLAMSESNLRRKLQEERTGFRELLEDLRLTHGLGLLQTTRLPINHVALECGYQSPSRFSERFKKRFRTTPSELRRTMVNS